MPPYVKICGITRLDDALCAIEAGADALGFNFYPGSPRFLRREQAQRLIEEIPLIHRVGVFVNADIQQVIDLAIDLSLDCVQFHGDESPEYCNQLARPWYKVFRLEQESELAKLSAYQSEWLMVDAYSKKARGGTGECARWDLAIKAKTFGKLILAGGLTPDNVEQAIRDVRPDAVDVASGVERSPGIKDPRKLERLIAIVKQLS